jgi:threonine dehydratase
MQDTVDARTRTSAWVRRTPLMHVDADAFAGDVWLKCEFMQHTGTFKARGAFNRILAAQERNEVDATAGIVVGSGGNAGLAYAFAASRLGVPATVIVPETAPKNKVDRLLAIGANVIQRGTEYAHAQEGALAHSLDTGALYCHAYDQPDMVSGAGGIGLELLEDLPRVDTVLVAVGGGGLVAGIAAAVGDAASVVGIEPVTAPTLNSALAAGAPVDVDVSGIAADSLGARRLGTIAFDVAQREGIQSLLVSDEDIIAARRRVWDTWRIVIEHGAAAAFAALSTGAYVPATGETVAVILCGSNTDPATI